MNRLNQISIHMFDYKKLQDNLEYLKATHSISDEYDSEKLSQIETSKLIDEKIQQVASDIISPLIKSKRNNLLFNLEHKLPTFIQYCDKINHLNYRLNPERENSYSKDTTILEKSLTKIKNKKIDAPIKSKLLHLNELLMQHFQKMDLLTKQKKSELEDILFALDDFETLKKTLYETILIYGCIMVGLDRRTKQLVSLKTFNTFANLGNESAIKLDKHTDELMEFTKSSFEIISTTMQRDESSSSFEMEKSKFDSETFLKILKTYQKEKISLVEFYPHLYELKTHLQSTYDITSHSEDIFENLATTIQKIFDKKSIIYEPTNSLDLKIIESILALSEITPMNTDVAESLHVILNLES